MKDKKFLSLSALFFLLFIAGIGVLILDSPGSQILRAKNEAPSPLKSFAVVFPQVGVAGSADRQTKIKVSVYMRDVNGNVLENRSVKVSSSLPAITITPQDTQTTNNIGLAQYFITSSSAGRAQLTATDVASNISIVNIPTVEFTE